MLKLEVLESFIGVLALRIETDAARDQDLEETFESTFLVDEFHNWIREDPMLHPGGVYGMLYYCVEHLKAPEWLLQFSSALV